MLEGRCASPERQVQRFLLRIQPVREKALHLGIPQGSTTGTRRIHAALRAVMVRLMRA